MGNKERLPEKIDVESLLDEGVEITEDSGEIEVLDPVTGGPVEGEPRKSPAPVAGDRAEAPATPAAKSLEKALKEVEKYKDLWIHSQADFENFKKRIERDRRHEETQAGAAVVRDLLSILDNLDRAVEGADHDDPFVQGIILIHKQLREALERAGLERIEATNEPFDPVFHEAVATEQTSAIEPNHVLSEVQKGYMFRGRVLRPALVKVSARPTSPGGSEKDAPPEQS
ncbi:MAG: nucleotide exchange factor GrpE [Acidobacteriota bacterium]